MSDAENSTVKGALFVGRKAELEELAAYLDDHLRLISVVGPPGSGKSELARHLLEHVGPAESLVVDLAGVASSDEMARCIATALGMTLAGSDAATDLIGNALAARTGLIVLLDNVDAAVDALAAALPGWLEAAPQILFLCTSREPLHLDLIETVSRLGPLAVREGAKLFEHWAARARSSELPAADAGDVRAIVDLLEGNPLAIRLAACRAGALSTTELRTRLQKPLDVLASRQRDSDPRHRSIRAALQVSWQLLSEQGQRALSELSVFRAAFDLEAAEAVLSRGCASALDVLDDLQDRSLLRAYPAGPRARYQNYRTVRAFAAVHLDDSSRESVERRHADWVIERAERAALDIDSLEAREALQSIEELSLELGAVVERFADEESELAIRAARILACAYNLRSPASTVGLLSPLIERCDKGTGAELELLIARAWAYREVREMDRAKGDAQRAAELAESVGRSEEQARALQIVGDVDKQIGRYQEAANHYQRALDALGPDRRGNSLAGIAYGQALVQHLLGTTSGIGHYDEVLSICQQAGTARIEARVDNSRAVLFFEHGHTREAKASLLRSCSLSRLTGGTQAEGIAWLSVGDIELQESDAQQAREAWKRAEACFERMGFELGLGFVATGRASLALEENDLGRARALCERALSAALKVSFRTLSAQCHGLFAIADLFEGEIERASKRIHQAVQEIEVTRDARFYSLILSLSAWVHHLRGDADAARVDFQAARQRLEELDTITASKREVVEILWRACRGESISEVAISGWEPRIAKRLVAESGKNRASSPSAFSIAVARDAAWFAVDERRVDLSRRGALRRILLALLKAQQEDPRRSLSVYELLEVGWPGQEIHAEAGAQRVYWVIATLRKLGLGPFLRTDEHGYALEPALQLEWN
jgi:predicted ATPase